ncbi:MAG TPA: glycoside hydrolase family 43 protein [Burkholderiales bacterium]|nr:glycoside hydrolase family 43 protein [Burkholderiales bacterium]
MAAFLTSCASAPQGEFDAAGKTYLNPVLDRDFPDPAVLRAPNGWFYAYATQGKGDNGTMNIQVARSRDLVHWTHLGDALPEKALWAATKQQYWAPHVVYDGAQQRYYMYYSAEPDGASGKCLAVATSGAPAGPFIDSGKPLLCGEGIENIDPMAFDDPATGKRLLYWGSGGGPIRVRELAAGRLDFLPGSTPVDVLLPDESEYRSLIEGAWVTFKEGTYYLFYSGDRCCTRDPRYAVMVARAASAVGPFERLGGAILEANETWLAPGHNSIATDDAGDDWIVYHAYRGDARVMMLDRVVYADGWPRVAGGHPSTTPQAAPATGR